MAPAARARRVLDPARLLLVLAAVVGILGMHALVVGAPTSLAHTTHARPAGSAAAPATSGPDAPAAVSVAGATDSAGTHGTGHDPIDHSGLAHLCLALAAAVFLLLVRRFLVRATLAGPDGPATRVRAAAVRWIRPPPDLVGALCASRT